MTDSQQITGLLFDKDGTLFDFSASWSGVIDEILLALTPVRETQILMARASGYDPVTKVFQPGSASVAGATAEIAEIWAGFLPNLTTAQVEAMANEVGSSAEATGALSPAVPDMPGFMQALQRAGLTLGVATHDSEAAAKVHLSQAGCLDSFDFIAGYDSGHGLKPGPGMLLAFSKSTGIPPAKIAMIGDSLHDLGVAPAAGAAMAIGVLTGPADREDLAPLADHVLDSIADLPDLLGIRL